MRSIRWVLITVIKLLVAALLKVQVQGLERVPLSGAVILATNHINSSDAFVVRAIMPRDITAWAKAEIWQNPLLRTLVESLEMIPLRRGELDLHSVRLALGDLAKGKMIGIAPEGTRSWHGRLQQGRPGLVFLTQHAPETFILPTAVYGQERFRNYILRLRRTPVNVVFGQGFHLDVADGQDVRKVRREIIDEVMAQIAALLPPEYRGVYGDLSAATERFLLFPPGATSSLQRALATGATMDAEAQEAE